MSSNAIANPPANKFEEILSLFQGNGASIKENVDTSKKKEKFSDEAKAALVEKIQENLSGIDLNAIKKKDNENGLLSSQVLTLEDSSSEQLAKMSATLSDVLKLIERSGGVDKTFLSTKSEENVELRKQVVELATVASMTKNEPDNVEASTVKSLSEAVIAKTNPKLFVNPKAGLTQDETNAVKMMLFANDDGTAFAGALKLLQSVKKYDEVAPNTLTEKEVDGVSTLKAKAGSFYKKIERALGNSESANLVKQVLKHAVDTTLHGRLNEEQQAVLRNDPSLNNVYNRVHNDLVSTIDDAGRAKLLKPLKEEIDSTFKSNDKIGQYFGTDVSDTKVTGLLRKVITGIVNMVRPSSKGYVENAFGKESFYETNQKLANLGKEAGSALNALNTLESSIGTVQQRVEDGGASRLDIPLSVIAKSGAKGEALASELLIDTIKSQGSSLEKLGKANAELANFEVSVKAEMKSPAEDKNSAITEIINKLGNIEVEDASKNRINSELTNLTQSTSKDIGTFTVTKVENDKFNVKFKGTNDSLELNQENTKNLLASSEKLISVKDQASSDEAVSAAQRVYDKANEAYAKINNTDKLDLEDKDERARKENFNKLDQFIAKNPSLILDALAGNTVSVFFGLDKAKTTDDKKHLEALAELVPDVKSDVATVKNDLEALSRLISKEVKEHSANFAHISLTSGAALKEGLLDADGATFKVANSLKQNLFTTALNTVKDDASGELAKIANLRNAQEADLVTVSKNINSNQAFTDLINNQQQNNTDPKTNANSLKTELEKMAKNKDSAISSFAEEFLTSENKALLKIEGSTQQDKAKYQAALSNLALQMVYTNEEDKTKAEKVAKELSSFIDENNLKSTKLDSNSDSVKDLRAEVAKTRNVLDSVPDTKVERGLRDITNDRIKDFNSLDKAPVNMRDKILEAMVKGLVEMAKSSAVKLEPLAEMLKTAAAPGDNNEATFFNKLKGTLIAA